MSEVSRTSDKPICPLCNQRIYGGCMCISAEYSVRIKELQDKLDNLEQIINRMAQDNALNNESIGRRAIYVHNYLNSMQAIIGNERLENQ